MPEESAIESLILQCFKKKKRQVFWKVYEILLISYVYNPKHSSNYC